MATTPCSVKALSIRADPYSYHLMVREEVLDVFQIDRHPFERWGRSELERVTKKKGQKN